MKKNVHNRCKSQFTSDDFPLEDGIFRDLHFIFWLPIFIPTPPPFLSFSFPSFLPSLPSHPSSLFLRRLYAAGIIKMFEDILLELIQRNRETCLWLLGMFTGKSLGGGYRHLPKGVLRKQEMVIKFFLIIKGWKSSLFTERGLLCIVWYNPQLAPRIFSNGYWSHYVLVQLGFLGKTCKVVVFCIHTWK